MMPLNRHAGLVAMVPALLLPAAGQAQTAPSARVTGYGEVSATRDLGLRDPGTIEGSGTVRLWEGATITGQTSRIEARLCGRFGMLFVVDGLGAGGILGVTIQSRHPQLVNPSGQVSTGVRYTSTVATGQPGLVGYTFDHPWEMVPGTWTFSVQLGDKVLAEQAFEVVAPSDGGQLLREGCSALLS